MSYIDGFLAPVLAGQSAEDYRAFAARAAPIFRDHGATRVVEGWGDDVPRGTRTDFWRAVDAQDGETVVFSWIEWPDKATRDAGMAKVMADPRMQPGDTPMPFDGKRLIFGGFRTLLDEYEDAMTNPHGTPIWYELQSADPDAAARFYGDVVGWTVGPRPDGDMDYRMIDTGDGQVGGLARFTPGVTPAGMAPGWTFYLGVDDVDATAATLVEAGGKVKLAPFDLPGVGRMAFVADPQGTPFYIMRGATADATSTAWDRTGMGKCNWNELATADQAGAHDFFARVFGWRYPDRMPMGPMGDYVFVEAGGEQIGATMTAGEGRAPGWRFHFRVPDIDAAAARVTSGGGTVHAGPMEVSGGERIVIASDPEGLPFGLVAGGDAA